MICYINTTHLSTRCQRCRNHSSTQRSLTSSMRILSRLFDLNLIYSLYANIFFSFLNTMVLNPDQQSTAKLNDFRASLGLSTKEKFVETHPICVDSLCVMCQGKKILSCCGTSKTKFKGHSTIHSTVNGN